MESQIIQDLRYFFAVQKYKWKTFFAYRSQAVLWCIYSTLSVIFTYITINVIYNVSSGIPGWSYYQLLILGATGNIALGMVYYMIGQTSIIWMMRQGQIDNMLTKPYSKLAIFLSNFGDSDSLAGVISGIILFIYALSHTSITPVSFALYILLLLFGISAFLMFLLMLIILAYRLFKSGNFIWRLTGMLGTVSKYPLKIYGLVGQFTFSLLIPIGFAYLYPAQALFSQQPNYLLSSAAIVVCVCIVIISYFGFERFIRTYTSGAG